MVLDGLAGQLHERLFERRLKRRQLGEHDLFGEGDLADLLSGEAVDLEHASLDAVDARVVPGERVA